MWLTIFCSLLLSKLTSSQEVQNPLIIGGFSEPIERAPYQIALEYYGGFTCGGTLVSANAVVTAAHCVSGRTPTGFSIRYGSSNRSQGTKVNVIKATVHPLYSSTSSNYDIAVLKLASNVPITSRSNYIQPASSDPAPGTWALVTGWGRTSTGTIANELQGLYVPIVDRATCRQKIWFVTDQMICAGDPNSRRGFCFGDSGGPLVVNNQLVGVVSYVINNCVNGYYPDVYADVPALRNFILSNK